MRSVRRMWHWAVASNERAVANAREAATECCQRRLERAEVELFLADMTRLTVEVTAETAATGR